MGYPKEIKGYYFYYKSENKIVAARHVVFFKKEFLTRENNGSNVRLEEIQVAHENNIVRDFIIPSTDTEASESGTLELSYLERLKALPYSEKSRSNSLICILALMVMRI
jgi:hypothetical protein